ncbi:MAG TPA: PA14 domain-containing protein, partial [Candidatus Limnocylindria bacterium]|nr:PA14 domain-containing protein [Candidatus Limnocylindria bacterium]
NRAYLTAGYGGLNTVDVSDPASPVLLGTYATSERALDLQVRGGVAYVAQDSLLQILDMSNPLQPVLVGGIPFFERNHFESVQVVGSRIFASGDREVKIFQNLLPRQILLSTPTPPGTELNLYPEVIGPGAATFQWYFGDLPLPGETNEFLHLPEVTSATAGTYTLEVTSAGYTGRNDPVTVYLPPPVILQPPADLAIIAGLSNVLSMTAGGLPDLKYQWRHEGVLLAGQTNRILPLSVTNLTALGGYDVVVSNPYGVATSRVAQVTLVTNVAEFFVRLTTLKSLPDGRVLLGGIYTNSTALYSNLLVRLLPDLSQDVTFQAYDPGATVSLPRITAGPDGRLALLGTFVAGQFSYLRRLNPDGSADPGFVSLAGSILPPSAPTDLASDGSGRLLVAGSFATGGQEKRALVRLLPDGSRDPVFAANLALSLAGNAGNAVVEQRDGRLIVAGNFRNAPGTVNRNGIARLFPDGTPDDSFATGAGFIRGPGVLALDSQERVLVAGNNTEFDGQAAPGWIRLNPNGTRDASFVPAISGTGIVQMAALRSGQIVVRLSDGTVQLFSETGALLNDYGKSDSPFAVEPAGSILFGAGFPPRLVRLDPPTPLAPEVEFGWGTTTVHEADGIVQMPVRRTGPVNGPAQVAYHVRAGTAVAGADFVEADGVIQFSAGVREASLSFPLSAQNSKVNDDRTILVQLDSAVGASVATARSGCVVTIEDDDVGLTAEIFASQSGNPILAPNSLVSTRNYYQRKIDQHLDDQVFFEWDGTAPRGVTNDYFSIVWTGWIVPEVTGQYQLATLADDGSRVWLDDGMVVSNWLATTFVTAKSGLIQLEAGKPHRLVVNYFEQTGQATCRLLWSLPGTNALTPIPRRVLRPGSPEFIPPTVSGSELQITYSSEAGRPITLQTSSDGKDWKFQREAVSSVGGVPNSFSTFGLDVRNVALIRAVSVDGLMATNALAPLIRVNGFTDGGDFSLFDHEANSISFSVPVYDGIGQSIAWFRDGESVGVGSPLVVSGLDARPAGKYQAVVTYPFGQVMSNVRGVNLIEVLPPRVSIVGAEPDGLFHIHGEGSPTHPERYVRVDVSTDLQHWETVAFNLGAFDVGLPQLNGPAQFFRLVLE